MVVQIPPPGSTTVSTSIDLSPAPAVALPRERRRAPRHPTLQRCSVWPPGAQGPAGLPSIAYNISTTGIGITLPLPLPKGHLLRIEPFALPDARPLQARIVHVKPVEFLWFCGCRFVEPIREEELGVWLVVKTDWLRHNEPRTE
jgi:hypothetical protein